MDRLPELRKMKASSLTPELYGEISEFFSSVKPDLTISGKMSLYTIYTHLQGAKERLRTKRLRRAEELIRAICAAADVREMQFGRTAASEGKAERKPKARGVMEGGQSQEMTLREKKMRLIEFAVERFFGGAAPATLDYMKRPEILAKDFSEISELIGLAKFIERIRPPAVPPEEADVRMMGKFSDPKEIVSVLERIGFRQYAKDPEQVAYGRIKGGEISIVTIQTGIRYGIIAFTEAMSQAGVTREEFRMHAGAQR